MVCMPLLIIRVHPRYPLSSTVTPEFLNSYSMLSISGATSLLCSDFLETTVSRGLVSRGSTFVDNVQSAPSVTISLSFFSVLFQSMSITALSLQSNSHTFCIVSWDTT